MSQIVPQAVERYLGGLNHLADPLLVEIARRGEAERLPLVGPEVGALLRVLARACGARRILEIGTAVGYSTIWLAGALAPDGMLITLELNEERAAIARDNVRQAGFADRVTVIVGNARRTISKVSGPFDLIFQDGDKQLYGPLLDQLVALLRPGGLLLSDNVLWSGDVVPGFGSEPRHNPDDTRAVAAYNERLNSHPSLFTSIVPLRDGVAISVRR